MNDSIKPLIALAATDDLPIARGVVETVAANRATVMTVPLPYRLLDEDEVVDFARRLQGADGLLLRSGYVTDSLLSHLTDLKVIAVHGAGVDPVDLRACEHRGVVVTNAPGANAAAVAELTIGLMLASLRGIARASHLVQTERAWDAARHTGGELGGRTLGLIGLGQIGRRVATLATAFGMEVVAHDPGLSPTEVSQHGVQPMTFEALCASADVISLHAPAIPATRHLIDAHALGQFKPGAILINCARGSLVDETALADALNRGHLAAAALDVMEGEPPDPLSPLFDAPNILLTPHMAGSTLECLEAIAHTAAIDIIRVFEGQAPFHRVV